MATTAVSLFILSSSQGPLPDPRCIQDFDRKRFQLSTTGSRRCSLLGLDDLAHVLRQLLHRLPKLSIQIGRAHVELQSQSNLVCRLLLEKKKKNTRLTKHTKTIISAF